MKSKTVWGERERQQKTRLDKGRRSIVPGVAIKMRGILENGQGMAMGLLGGHSSLVSEGHSTVQAVLTSKHSVSMEDLHERGRVSDLSKGQDFQECSPPSSWRANRHRSPRFRWRRTASVTPPSRGGLSNPSSTHPRTIQSPCRRTTPFLLCS